MNTLNLLSLGTVACDYSVLCKSVAGVDVPLLTVNDLPLEHPQPPNFIVLNARTHPGQASSSWVIDGLLRQIVESQSITQQLQEHSIVLKIVPMLNSEGVLMGNYRTGVLGVDFNRHFNHEQDDIFPEIAGLKQLVSQCKERGNVHLFLDVHGHSINPGCFIYGPELDELKGTPYRRLLKQLKQSPHFIRSNCKMKKPLNTKKTSRQFFEQQQVTSLTCEASLGLYCPHQHQLKHQQMLSHDWQNFGRVLLQNLVSLLIKYLTFQNSQADRQRYHETISDPFTQNRRHKTEGEDFQRQIDLMIQMQKAQVVLPRPSTTQNQQQDTDKDSLNDSDSSSEDLTARQREDLFAIARRVIQQRHRSIRAFQLRDSSREHKMRRTYQNGKFINNLKEYRFGTEDNTMVEWSIRRRMLSMPRCIKHERGGGGSLLYSIKKVPPRATFNIPSRSSVDRSSRESPSKDSQSTPSNTRRVIFSKNYSPDPHKRDGSFVNSGVFYPKTPPKLRPYKKMCGL